MTISPNKALFYSVFSVISGFLTPKNTLVPNFKYIGHCNLTI